MRDMEHCPWHSLGGQKPKGFTGAGALTGPSQVTSTHAPQPHFCGRLLALMELPNPSAPTCQKGHDVLGMSP